MTNQDLVPTSLRAEWSRGGYYPDRDLYSLFEHHATAHPEHEAVVDDSGTIRYGALATSVRRLANQLAGAGAGPGQVIAVQLPNSWESCAVQLAVVATGAICLTYPMTAQERESAELLGRSGAVAVVVPGPEAGDHAAMVERLRGRLPTLRRVLVTGEASGEETALDPSRGDDRWQAPRIDPNGPAWILTSSGTEASPKLVLYSHNGMAGGRGNFIAGFGVEGMRCWTLVPLASGLGSNGVCSVLARHGATLILSSSFSPDRLAEGLGTRRPTHLLGVPSMLRLLLASPVLADADVSSLHVVVMGGEPARESQMREVEARLGCRCILGYGSSDGVNCHPGLDDPPEKRYSTVGRPDASLASVRIVDDSGHDLPCCQLGEIWARGPISPLCYFNSPELNARYRTADGWLRTGDLGLIDGNGYLVVTGRIKDVIIRGGLTISAARVETLIQAHPAVLSAACIGVPDDLLGERVCACVVPRPGCQPPDLPALQAHLLESGLDRHCLPERLELLSELPVNASGKVVKRRLASQLGLATGVGPGG